MITVSCGTENQELRSYAVATLLGDWLGLPFQLRFDPKITSDWVLNCAGKLLTLPDLVLANEFEWKNPQPKRWQIPAELQDAGVVEFSIPVLFHREGDPDFKISPASASWNCDVFGAAAALLTRLEENSGGNFDERGRFIGAESHAARFGYLDRPLLDEYSNLLAALLRRLDPALNPSPPQFRIELSHDVDHPFRYRTVNPATAVGRGFKDAGIAGALRAVGSWTGWIKSDPYDTFNWLFKCAEDRELRSTLYFIAKAGSVLDGTGTLERAAVRKILVSAVERGHRAGLHGSYRSYDDCSLLRQEKTILEKAIPAVSSDGGIPARQHYLRWRPATMKHLADVGFLEDGTLGYQDRPGFRAGTARKFRWFDRTSKITTGLFEQPLVLMDATLLSPGYLNLGGAHSAAADLAVLIKNRCRKAGGVFSLLWHNNNAVTEPQRRLLSQILDA